MTQRKKTQKTLKLVSPEKLPEEVEVPPDKCSNPNHGMPDPPIRFCPSCGDVLNSEISNKQCDDEKHELGVRVRHQYCFDCGKKLL